jgi:hypothetical protein
MTDVRRTLRVYADTSVFGACFDDEFRAEYRSPKVYSPREVVKD